GCAMVFEHCRAAPAKIVSSRTVRASAHLTVPAGCIASGAWRSPMNLTALIIQLIAGALGGNAAGSVAKDVNLGPLGNSLAGAIGGGLGGQILSAILGLGGTAAASGMDMGSIVSAFLTGGVSGGATALIVGFLKAKLAG